MSQGDLLVPCSHQLPGMIEAAVRCKCALEIFPTYLLALSFLVRAQKMCRPILKAY